MTVNTVVRVAGLVFTAFALTACGGSGGGSSTATPENDEQPPSLPDSGGAQAFPDTEPELTTRAVSHGSVFGVNTLATADIAEGSEMMLTFRPAQDGFILVKLDSDADDLDMYIESSAGQWDSVYDQDSDELILLNADAAQDYYIHIDAYHGGGAFTLRVTDANRETAGLKSSESLLKIKTKYSEESITDCSSATDPMDTYLVLDRENNQVDYGTGVRGNFILANGNQVIIDADIRAVDYQLDSEMILTLNLSRYTLTGTSEDTETRWVNGVATRCTSYATHTGLVLY
ncbi:MAG: hypothetical protein CMH98_05580 [Oceanospirillaceae bacterium]|nr:hypothetical protein [Oceanospirillaceae bacterium]